MKIFLTIFLRLAFLLATIWPLKAEGAKEEVASNPASDLSSISLFSFDVPQARDFECTHSKLEQYKALELQFTKTVLQFIAKVNEAYSQWSFEIRTSLTSSQINFLYSQADVLGESVDGIFISSEKMQDIVFKLQDLCWSDTKDAEALLYYLNLRRRHDTGVALAYIYVVEELYGILEHFKNQEQDELPASSRERIQALSTTLAGIQEFSIKNIHKLNSKLQELL